MNHYINGVETTSGGAAQPAIRDQWVSYDKSTGVGHFGPKFPGVPLQLPLVVDPWCLALQRANIPG